MLNVGRVLSRAQLEDKLYAWGNEVESNAVEVHLLKFCHLFIHKPVDY